MEKRTQRLIKAEWRDYYMKYCDKSWTKEPFETVFLDDIASFKAIDVLCEEFKEFAFNSSKKLMKKKSFFDFFEKNC